MADRTVMVRLVADTTAYMAGMGKASAATTAFGTKATASGKAGAAGLGKMGGAAAALPAALNPATVGIAGIGVAAAGTVKAAIDWESAWTGVRKTVDGSPEQMQALEGSLRGLATQLPATHAEIAGVAEAAGQLGVKTEDIEGFTKTMIDLGETTNLSADEAATSLARFANIMGTSTDQMENLGSSIVDLGNNFATTEAEIVEMGMRLAGAGKTIGLTEGEVFGLSTALTSVGINAEAGGTAFSRVMVDIGKSVDMQTPKMAEFARIAGLSAQDFATMWRDDAGQALTLFVQGLGQVEESGGSISQVLDQLGLDGIRVADALRRSAAAGDLMADAMDTGNRAFDEGNALQAEAEMRYETTAAKLDIARNAVNDLAIEIGDGLLPVVAETASGLAEIAGLFTWIENSLPTASIGEFEFKLSFLKGSLFQVIDAIKFANDVNDEYLYTTEQSTAATEAWSGRLAGQAAAHAEAQRAVEANTVATVDATAESEEYAAAVDELSGAQEDLESALDDSYAALQDHTSAFQTDRTYVLDFEAAIDGLSEALSEEKVRFGDATTSSGEHTSALDLTTEAGRNAEVATYELAAAMNDEVKQRAENIRETQGHEAAMAFLEKQLGKNKEGEYKLEAAMYDAMVQAGMSEEAARTYAGQLALTPSDIRTVFSTPGLAEAQRAVEVATNKVADLAAALQVVQNNPNVSVDQAMDAARRDRVLAGRGGSGGVGMHGERPMPEPAEGIQNMLSAVNKQIAELEEQVRTSGPVGAPGQLLGGSYYVSSGYGMRDGALHGGVDLATDAGTPVFAPWGGVVRAAWGGSDSYGNYVFLDTGGKYDFLGAHLSRFGKTGRVSAGDVIGYVGSTGNSSGPHLHAEVRQGGARINPAGILKYDTGGVLPHGYGAVNLSRRPEAVLTNEQWSDFRALVDAISGGGNGFGMSLDGARIELSNIGVIGDHVMGTLRLAQRRA